MFAGIATANANAAAAVIVQNSGKYTASSGTPWTANGGVFISGTAGTAGTPMSSIFVGWAESTTSILISPQAASPSVASSNISDGTIVNADINANAAIATSKLSGPLTSIASNGLGALATKNTVSNGDISDLTYTAEGSGGGLDADTVDGVEAAELLAKAGGTMTGTVTFSGVASDMTTGTNEHIALMPNGTGNVGIGTTTPGESLHISDSVAGIRIQDSDTDGNAAFAFIQFFDSNSTTGSIGDLRSDTNDLFIRAEESNLRLGDSSSLDVMILNSGNVGIGTTSPSAKLGVAGQYFSTKNALTDGATIAIDWDDGNVQSVTLGGNRTITFSNQKSGAVYTLMITQDGTGSRTLTWPATAKWPGGVTPTLTTTVSALDIFTFVSDGTNGYNIGFASDVK